MRIIKKILSIIFNPLSIFYAPHVNDQIVKQTNKYDWIVYLVSLLLTVGIILIVYRGYIFG